MQPLNEISGSTWDVLIPNSFQSTLYVPSLKITITAGSFILYCVGDSTAPQVGRILDIAHSIALIPHAENHPLLHSPFPDKDIPKQFAKVNVFQDRLLATQRNFPADNFSDCDGWQQVVQLDEFQWIPSHVIIGLSFVFMEEHLLSHSFDASSCNSCSTVTEYWSNFNDPSARAALSEGLERNVARSDDKRSSSSRCSSCSSWTLRDSDAIASVTSVSSAVLAIAILYVKWLLLLKKALLLRCGLLQWRCFERFVWAKFDLFDSKSRLTSTLRHCTVELATTTYNTYYK